MTSVDHLADEVLSALVDEELSPAELQAARAHVRTCDFCTDQFDALRTLQGMLRQLPEIDPPRDFSIGPRLVADPPNVIRLQRWYTATRAAAASLAAVFVLLVAGTLYVDTAVAPAQQRTAFEVSTSQNTAPASAPGASGAAAANPPAVPPAAKAPANPPAPAARPTTAPAAAANPAPAAAVARDAGAPPPAAPAAGASAPAQSRAVTLARTPETTTDLTAAATRVQPLPTRPPVAEPVGAPAPTVVAQAAVPAALDPATPLRTAAVAVGLLAVLVLLCALIVRHRLGRVRAPLSIQE